MAKNVLCIIKHFVMVWSFSEILKPFKSVINYKVLCILWYVTVYIISFCRILLTWHTNVIDPFGKGFIFTNFHTFYPIKFNNYTKTFIKNTLYIYSYYWRYELFLFDKYPSGEKCSIYVKRLIYLIIILVVNRMKT